MATKKSIGGEGTEKSPTRRKNSSTTKPKEPTSSAKPSKRARIVGIEAPITDSRIPTREELQTDIAKRAYELYERRGWRHGQELNDWLEAEQEILTEKSLAKS